MRFTFFVITCFYACAVRANTEIVNFGVAPINGFTLPSPLIRGWPTLNFTSREQKFILVPGENGVATECDIGNFFPTHCPHQLWVVCDAGALEWNDFSAFTLRLSWPASKPAVFDLVVFSGTELFNQSIDTRLRYARITALKDSVQIPSTLPNTSASSVAFHLILEPLYFGLLPESLVPLLWLTVPILIIAHMFAQKVYGYLRAQIRTKEHDY